MPSSNRRRVIGALALGMAALAPALALGMAAALLSVSVRQKPVNAPQLSSAGLLQDADFRLSDHRQLRRPFFEESRDQLR